MASATHSERTSSRRLFHALADEMRLEIIERLRRGERCVCELTDALDAAQSRLSFHLKTLKDAGLVSDRREGRWVYYRLNADAFADLEQMVGALQPTAGAIAQAAACCD